MIRLDLEFPSLFEKVEHLGLLVGKAHGGFDELEHAEHVAVVGDRHRRNAQLVAQRKQLADARRAVKQRVFGMQMQMRKRFHASFQLLLR